MLFERHAARERSLVSGGERRLVRMGYDLHDGPLQELVALADDLRRARDQVASVLEDSQRAAVRGRFDDLEARLHSLDRGLRDIAHSVRATSAVEQPLEHALRQEVDALERTAEIKVELAVDGDVASLTDSQKIVLFRVVQEALCNIRKHSDATCASVRVRAVTEPDLVVRKVAQAGWSLYASPGYLARKGAPESAEALSGHDVVGYDDSLAAVPGALWLSEHAAGTKTVLRGNSIVAALNAATALSDAGSVNFTNVSQTLASLNGSGSVDLTPTALTVSGTAKVHGRLHVWESSTVTRQSSGDGDSRVQVDAHVPPDYHGPRRSRPLDQSPVATGSPGTDQHPMGRMDEELIRRARDASRRPSAGSSTAARERSMSTGGKARPMRSSRRRPGMERPVGTSTSRRGSCPTRIRSSASSPSRRAPTRSSPNGPAAVSSGSTARACRSCSDRRSHTAAYASRTPRLPPFGALRRSARRSGLRVERGERAEGEVAFRREERAVPRLNHAGSRARRSASSIMGW
jgi:hypothetical protein